MKLIRKTRTEVTKNGNKIRYGIFWCVGCKQEVEKQISHGERDKSYGCQRYSKERNEKISVANKDKERKPFTEEHRQKIGLANKGKKKTEEARNKISKATKGKNNPMYGKYGELTPNWNNGSSFEPYSPDFNKPLKQSVLERDNYTCQNPNCEHLSEGLDVHHINYDKKNSNPENLISLCKSCHIKTNFNRQYYTEFYQNIMMNKLMECLL